MQQPLALVSKQPYLPNMHGVLEDCCHFYPFDIFAKKCENNEKNMSFNGPYAGFLLPGYSCINMKTRLGGGSGKIKMLLKMH